MSSQPPEEFIQALAFLVTPCHHPFKNCLLQNVLHLTVIYVGLVPPKDRILDYMDQ